MRSKQSPWLWAVCCAMLVMTHLAGQAATYTIPYTLTSAGKVSLNIYDANGKVVRELMHATSRPAGTNHVVWDGLDNNGLGVPAGAYSWKMLCTPGLSAEFVMNLGGNYLFDPPGNHGGVDALFTDATGVYMLAASGENVCNGVKLSPTGTTLWKVSSRVYGYTAVAGANGTLFAKLDNGSMQKISAANGGAISTFTPPSGTAKVDADGTNLAVITASAVVWLDPASGAVLDTAPITTPKDLAIAADGTVYLISGTSVVTVTRGNHTPVNFITGLTSPTCLDIDHSTGDVLVFEAGTSQRVKRFSALGTLITTYGTAGGRVDGLYQPTDFFNITDLIADGSGGFYIAEPNNAPRRTTHFGSGGNVIKEWYGGQIWAPLITVEPDNPNVVWMASHWGYWMRLVLDYTTKTWQVHSTYNYANLGNGIIRQGCNDDTWVARVHNGTTYLCRLRYGTPFIVKVDETNWRLLPVAVAERINSDTPSYIKGWAGSNGSYSWVDQDGDGIPQQAECTFFAGGMYVGGITVDSDMNYFIASFDSRRLVLYPVIGWNAVGAPIYGNLPGGQTVGTIPACFESGTSWKGYTYHDTVNNEYYLAANSGAYTWGVAKDPFMVKWNSSGVELWQGRGVAPFRSLPGGTHNCVVGMGYNGGPAPQSFVWDRDGLFVGGLFDTVNLNGHAFYDYWLNADDLTGDFYTDPNTGAVRYFGCGENQGYVFDITGWDNWQRADGALTVTTPSADNTGQGLGAEYFDNADLTNLTTTRVDSAVDFAWGSSIPGGTAITAPTTYSTRWIGKVTPRYGPSYYSGASGGYFMVPAQAYLGTLHSNHIMGGSQNGAECVVDFHGTSIAWYGIKQTDGGTAQVYIDGVLQQTVSCQNNPSIYQTLIYSVTGLANTDHTLRIVSNSGAVSWDYFVTDGGIMDDVGETYTFYVTAKDGVRLWVNGQLLINNWGDHIALTEQVGRIRLPGRQQISLRLDYYNGTGSSTAQLSWSSPNQAKEIIPTSRLYPTFAFAAMPRDINNTIPGTIECENYESGGEGIAYHDLDTDNFCYRYPYMGWSDRFYRASEGVDIQPLWFGTLSRQELGINDDYEVEGKAGEWLKYLVNVTQTAAYTINVLVTTGDNDGGAGYGTVSGGTFHIEVDGCNVTGPLTVPACTNSQPYATVTKTGVGLTAGVHEVKLVFDTNAWTATNPTGSFASMTFTNTGSYTPPTVSLIEPLPNANFAAPAGITLTANASGSISKVEFYQGSTKLGEVTTSPYRFIWTNVPQGTYTLRAVATETDGDVASSTITTVYVRAGTNTPPTVSLTAPTDGTTFTAPGTLTLTATASDSDGISKVEFYADAVKLAEATAAPYSYSWSSIPSGTYAVTAVAVDSLGARTNSAVAYVTDTTLPCALPTFSPAAGMYSSAQTVTISTATSGASIRYTTDGSTPTSTTGTVYSTPVVLSSTTLLRAIAYKAGMTDSAVASGTFINTAVDPKLTGTVIGTPGSFNNNGNTIAKAFDGNVSTYFDGPTANGNWCGLDFGSGVSKVITKIRFYPRSNNAHRMVGGKFQGSTTADFSSSVTDLYSITTTPPQSTFTEAISIRSDSAFRYVRYLSPDNSYGNVAEIEFYGHDLQLPPTAAPTFSPAAGTYTTAQSVTMSTTTSGATIRYTTEGATPSQTNGTVYSSPVAVTGTMTLKAIAYKSGMSDSSVSTGVFTLNLKLTGTVIGTAGSFNNDPNYVKEKAFDGNTSTYFDGPTANGCWCGLDLGYGASKQIVKIRFYPRSGQATRMNGGKFQGSNTADFSSGVTDLYTIAGTPATGWTEVTSIGSSSGFRYVRYLSPNNSYGNVAEIEFYGDDLTTAGPVLTPAGGAYFSWQTIAMGCATPGATIRYTTDSSTPSQANGTVYTAPLAVSNCTVKAIAYKYNLPDSAITTETYTINTDPKLTGTVIGTAGSYQNNPAYVKEKVFDDNTSTYFDGPSADGCWCGLDLGNGVAKVITGIRYFPRSASQTRMVGGKFQGSNTADFSSGVTDLYIITATPPAAWSTTTSILSQSSFRYVRYLSPGGSYGNVAEIEFYGH